ncbi:MAG: ABC transporter ATP-binding protein [Pseudohongiellaceae bacterium]|nr:ABC transporter ATP-binding protein [Pseudohongiellaceae bacterium]
MNQTLELKDVSVALDGTLIVKKISFSLEQGAIGCLLGPSGCGKTTLLRTIAGFETALEGEIKISGQAVSNQEICMPVEKRHVGMVFQDYALFPHLSIRQNIEFGLEHLSKSKRRERVEELARLLKITELLEAYPHRLSGGQQQRVAVARAMAPKPGILLLDEPFASLDVELREQIAREIRMVLKQDGITAILVSHNQFEAFAMADEIGVMRSGELMQWSKPFDLYHEPSCAYVADFVGEGVFLTGTVVDEYRVETGLGVLGQSEAHGFEMGTTLNVLIRPDDVIHDDDSAFKAKVVDKAFRGAGYLYTLQLADGAHVLSLVPSHHDHANGEMIGIRVEMDHLVAFPMV